ncbi:MAG: TSUP family transporter [Clostridia bacterium]
MTFSKEFKYIATGILAGLANGFFGAGGGMLLVPLFTRWSGMDERRALATSVAVILPLCIVSAIIYLMRRDFSFLSALPFLLGGLIGGLIGGRIFKHVPTLILRRSLAIFILYGGVRSLFF